MALGMHDMGPKELQNRHTLGDLNTREGVEL